MQQTRDNVFKPFHSLPGAGDAGGWWAPQ